MNRSAACRCIRGWRACWSTPAARARWRRRARCCRSGICCRRARATTSSDLLSALDQWSAVPPHVKQRRPASLQISDRGLRISECRIRSDAFGARISSGDPRRLSGSRGATARAGLAERSARVGNGRGDRGGERRPRRRVPGRARRRPSPQSIRNRDRVRKSRGSDGEPASSASGCADLDPRSCTVSTRRAGRCARRASIATTRWCWRSVRCRPIRKSRAGLLADAWLARGPRDDDTRLLRRLALRRSRRRRRCAGPRGRLRARDA